MVRELANESVKEMLSEWDLGNTAVVAHLIAELYNSNDYQLISETMDEFRRRIGQYYAQYYTKGVRLIPNTETK